MRTQSLFWSCCSLSLPLMKICQKMEETEKTRRVMRMIGQMMTPLILMTLMIWAPNKRLKASVFWRIDEKCNLSQYQQEHKWQLHEMEITSDLYMFFFLHCMLTSYLEKPVIV